jgi:hypothetical protein
MRDQCPTIWKWLELERARGIPIRWLLVFLGQFYMPEVPTLGIFAAALSAQDPIASAVVRTLLFPEDMVVCNLFPEEPSPSGKNG